MCIRDRGDVAQTEDPVKRQAMVDAWTDFAERTLLLPEPQRPTGFSAPDVRPAPSRCRCRRHRRVDDSTGDGSADESDGSSCSQHIEDELNLDGVYGNARARPGDLSERRSWQYNDDHNWGRNNWVGQSGVPEGARTWVKDMMRTERDALAS